MGRRIAREQIMVKAAFHKDGCMCDECIKRRVIARKDREKADAEARGYINRRGGEIGSISVSGALKNRKS